MKHLIRCVCLLVLLIPYGIGQSPQSSAHSVHPKPLEATSAEQVWADLVEGNRRFVQGKPRSVDIIPLRQNLAKGSIPKLWS